MAADHDPALEGLSRQFLKAEIASGLTFARLAATAYAEGKRAEGDAITAKAEQAATEFTRWLQEAEARGWAVADLYQQFRTLRTALADLRARAQKVQKAA